MQAATGRRIAALVLGVALGSAVAACGSEQPASVGSAKPAGERLDAPALRRLEAQANRLLDGGTAAFEGQLADLRGHPVVVNQWASWCTSCRYEFPFFQRLAARYRGRVAFLGVDSQDNRGDAQEFMREFPTPFPHYFDPDGKIARLFRGGAAWPTTAFYNAAGELTETHIGAFASEDKLHEAVREYALGG